MFLPRERKPAACVEAFGGDYAARRRDTVGRCRRWLWKLTVNSKRCPGFPATSAHGWAQGDPRGQRTRGSILGLRLAGKRRW